MGLGSLFGGGSSKQSQSSSVSIPSWLKKDVKPLYKESARLGMEIAKQPYQRYGGQRVAGINPAMRTAMQGIYDAPNAAAYGDASNLARGMTGGQYDVGQGANYGAAKRYTGDVLAGKYMSGNPYLDDVLGKTKRGITESFQKSAMPQMQSNLARQGAFGGSGWAQANQDLFGELAETLGDTESQMRYQDYGVERGYMDKAISDALQQQGYDESLARGNLSARERGAGLGLTTQGQREGALGQAMQAGDLERTLAQQQMDVDYGDFTEERDWLFRALQGLQGGLGNTEGLYGRTGTGGGSGGGNLLGSLGQLAGGAGMFMQGWG